MTSIAEMLEDHGEAKASIWRIDAIQRLLKNIDKKMDEMKRDIGQKGYEVQFYNHLLEEGILCQIVPKGEDRTTTNVLIEGKSKVSDEDFEVDILGKYLALSRAYDMFME